METIYLLIFAIILFIGILFGAWQLSIYWMNKQTAILKQYESEGRCINVNEFIHSLKKEFLAKEIIVDSLDYGNTAFYIVKQKDNNKYDIWKVGENIVAANLTKETAIKLFAQWKERSKK